MSDLKFSLVWAVVGAVALLALFKLDFWVLGGSLPGYKIFAFPGVAFTSLFSHEIDYWPKLGIMLFGQYLAFIGLIYAARKFLKSHNKSKQQGPQTGTR